MSRRKKPESNGAAEAPVQEPERHLEPETTRPVATIRYANVKANVWRNETEQGTRFNVTFARIYKIGEDQWGQSTSFGARDLPLIEKAAAAALEFIRQAYDETPF